MKTKTSLLTILTLAAMTLLASCKGEDPEAGYSVSTDLLKVSDLQLLGNTADTVFSIEASSAWNLSVLNGDENTLNLSQKTGSGTGKVRITPGANPSATESRSWTLRVTTAAGLTRNISITQAGADLQLTVTPQTITLNAESDTIAVSVSSNAQWTAVLTGKAPGFAHFLNNVASGTGVGTISLVFDRNEDTEAREGGLQLTATNNQGQQLVTNVTIRQEGSTYNLNVHDKQKTLANSEQTFDISFHADLDWEVSVTGAWLTPEQYSGPASQTSLRIRADANLTINHRTADVILAIKRGGKVVASDTCHVSQEAFGAPEVEVLDPSAEETSATLRARCTTDVATVGVITACGFRYSTSEEELEAGGGTDVPCVVDKTGQDVVEINATITGLTNNATYYFVAYATNSRGTGQSPLGSFKTGGKDPNENDLTPPPTP